MSEEQNDCKKLLGVINFDSTSADSFSSEAIIPPDKRKLFDRNLYVSIYDKEQNIEFLGRVVKGPFYLPHEVSVDSAITRTTVLYPDRTKFRPNYFSTGTIEILGQLIEEQLVSTTTRPRPYSEISIFPPERLQKFLNINGDFFLGKLIGYDINVLADSCNKNFLPRNIGVFGTVGSGKSNTIQVIMEEAIKVGWAVVVIDVEGEYVAMNEPTSDFRLAKILEEKYKVKPEGINSFKTYVPKSGHSDAKNTILFKVPISKIDTYILSSLMDLTEPQERAFEQIVGDFGSNYNLQSIIDKLSESSENKSNNSINKSTARALIAKLCHLGRSQLLDWKENEKVPELNILELLHGGRLSIFDVSETDDRSRAIAIAYILQALFDVVIDKQVGEKMDNHEERPKILVVIEEVHTFVSKNKIEKMRAVLDNLQVISRRGRKRWLSLALVSQQPGHVPTELFELVNTRFIHQLKSIDNITPIRQTTGGVHDALWSSVPSFGSGQCLITSTLFSNPLFVEIRPSKTKRKLTD